MKEASIENDILQYLNYMGGYFWRTHSGKYPPTEKGISDINGLRGGVFYAVEVKKPGEKPTDAQNAYMVRVRGNKGRAFVATSVADVQEAMK